MQSAQTLARRLALDGNTVRTGATEHHHGADQALRGSSLPLWKTLWVSRRHCPPSRAIAGFGLDCLSDEHAIYDENQ
jgi:hypothetical protein